MVLGPGGDVVAFWRLRAEWLTERPSPVTFLRVLLRCSRS